MKSVAEAVVAANESLDSEFCGEKKMEKQRISQLLDELHAELSTAGELDVATAEKLRAAAAEIEAVVQETHFTDSQPLVQRLREAIYHLPDSHPTIKNAVGRIADALSQIGI